MRKITLFNSLILLIGFISICSNALAESPKTAKTENGLRYETGGIGV